MLRKIGIGFAVRGWNGRAITQSPHLGVALAAHGAVDNDTSAPVSFDRQFSQNRTWDDSRREDNGLGFKSLVGQPNFAALDRLDLFTRPNIGAAAFSEDVCSVSGKRRGDFRH